jgi:LysR family transcriptional regulator, glycine cleavage system transcriptional activator
VRRLPPLKTLPAFEISANALSFSVAAEALHLTHGAVSRQIKALEDHLGVALFRRLNRRIELTSAGLSLLPSVRQALQLLETSAYDVSAQTKQGPLVVSCLATFMMRWLIPRLYDFNTANSDIDVRLSASNTPVDFAADGVDIAIRVGKPPWPRGVAAHAFLADRVGPILSPTLLKKYRVKRPEDLRLLPLLYSETRQHAWSEWLTLAKVKDVDLTKATRFEHLYFLLEAAASGLGVAIGPYHLVEQDIKSGRLIAPFGFLPNSSSYYALHPARARDTKTIAFVTWIMESASTR